MAVQVRQPALFAVPQPSDAFALADQLAKAGRSRHTDRAYERAFKEFETFAEGAGERALPARPQTVGAFLTHSADLGKGYSDLRQRKAAISKRHRQERLGDPTADDYVRDVWRGIVKSLAKACEPTMAALAGAVQAIVESLKGETSLWDVRDRALVLVLWEGALTRTELRSVTFENIDFNDNGARIKVYASRDLLKNRIVTIEFGPKGRCAVRALRAWIDRAGITSGPIFRRITKHGKICDTPLHEEAIAHILELRSITAGEAPGTFSPHSFRFGRLAQAVIDGEDEARVFKRSGLHEDSLPALRAALKPAFEARKRGERGLSKLQAEAVFYRG